MSLMFKIFVGNLSFETTEDHLREVFTPHLEIEDLVIARDEETGQSKGYGFVLTRDADQGRRALRKIGKFEIHDRLVYTQEAHGGKKKPEPKPAFKPRTPRPSHRPPRGRAFNRPNTPPPQSDGGYVGAQRPPGPGHQSPPTDNA